jgi:hypothetical protein
VRRSNRKTAIKDLPEEAPPSNADGVEEAPLPPIAPEQLQPNPALEEDPPLDSASQHPSEADFSDNDYQNA